ncbi:MAG: peptidyl-tRNA hydrolase [Bacteroidales bacterium]|nr:peptidyl-tRNA hydrolase [Candidatus Latescibacterota bacterium]
MPDAKKLKMYILIREDVPDNFAPVIAAHAALLCSLCYNEWDEWDDWLNCSFKKVVCRVTTEQFDQMEQKLEGGDLGQVITESALGGADVAIVIPPMHDLDPFLRTLDLWSPNDER